MKFPKPCSRARALPPGAELWTDGQLTPMAAAALRERGYTISTVD